MAVVKAIAHLKAADDQYANHRHLLLVRQMSAFDGAGKHPGNEICLGVGHSGLSALAQYVAHVLIELLCNRHGAFISAMQMDLSYERVELRRILPRQTEKHQRHAHRQRPGEDLGEVDARTISDIRYQVTETISRNVGSIFATFARDKIPLMRSRYSLCFGGSISTGMWRSQSSDRAGISPPPRTKTPSNF